MLNINLTILSPKSSRMKCRCSGCSLTVEEGYCMLNVGVSEK